MEALPSIISGAAFVSAEDFGGGEIGNIIEAKKKADYQNYINDLMKNPGKLAALVAKMQQPLNQGLQQAVGNSVQGNMAERGLSQAPGIFAASESQALAPYYQQNQNAAMQSVLQMLGMQSGTFGNPTNNAPALQMFLKSLQGGGSGSSGGGGVGELRPAVSRRLSSIHRPVATRLDGILRGQQHQQGRLWVSLLTCILGGLGRGGNEFAEARSANEQEKRQKLEQQFKMQQFKMQMEELNQRLATGKAPQYSGSYQTPTGQEVSRMRDPLTGKMSEVPGGQGRVPNPPATKAKYADLKQDAKGKWWGLNTQTQQMEQIPGQDEFKAAPKVTAGGKVNPIITAQIGKPPDASAYPKGEDDPVYKAKMKQWGVQAETVANRMAQQRGIGYNFSKIGTWINQDGELVPATSGQALAGGFVQPAPGFQALSKQAQFQEMNNASGKLRSAIQALEPGDAFSPEQVAKLSLAAKSPDVGTFSAIVSNMASSTLNEHQQDYLIWLQQMGERILSLRNVAGMGQGAQDLRSAIQATLPNISSGTKEFALKRLDAVDNQINLLQKGIPKVSRITGNQGGRTQRSIVVSRRM